MLTKLEEDFINVAIKAKRYGCEWRVYEEVTRYTNNENEMCFHYALCIEYEDEENYGGRKKIRSILVEAGRMPVILSHLINRCVYC